MGRARLVEYREKAVSHRGELPTMTDKADCWACGAPNVMRPSGRVECADACAESRRESDTGRAPHWADDAPSTCFECEQEYCVCYDGLDMAYDAAREAAGCPEEKDA